MPRRQCAAEQMFDRMKRRDAISWLGATAASLAWPAFGQRGNPEKVGLLYPGLATAGVSRLAAFREGLRKRAGATAGRDRCAVRRNRLRQQCAAGAGAGRGQGRCSGSDRLMSPSRRRVPPPRRSRSSLRFGNRSDRQRHRRDPGAAWRQHHRRLFRFSGFQHQVDAAVEGGDPAPVQRRRVARSRQSRRRSSRASRRPPDPLGVKVEVMEIGSLAEFDDRVSRRRASGVRMRC